MFPLSLKAVKWFCVLFFAAMVSSLGAQDAKSQAKLLEIWQDESQTDTARVLAYQDYIWYENLFSNPDSAKILIKELFEFCTEQKYIEGQSAAFNLMGIAESVRGNYYRAVRNYEKSLSILEKLGDEKAISASLNNIGNIYVNHGQYVRSLAYYEKALKLSNSKGNEENKTAILISIATVYYEQGNLNKAIDYTQKALDLAIEKKIESSIASAQMNLATIYHKKDQYNKSIQYAKQSLQIQQELNNLQAVTSALLKLGENYRKLGELDTAMLYFKKAIITARKVGDRSNIARAKIYEGRVHLEKREFQLAMKKCRLGLNKALQFKLIKQKRDACDCLYESHKAVGNGKEALKYYELMNKAQDSLNLAETRSQLERIEFAKKLERDSLYQAKKELTERLAHQEELNKKNKTKNLLIGLSILAFVLAISFYSRTVYIRKAKAKIEEEKRQSENLLLNILPNEIAQELKSTGKAKARSFNSVSILFTDFKEFTQHSEMLSPEELVNEINYFFKQFDEICEKYKIEKIKTIGDSYMAAGGLPVPSQDSVKNTVLAALEMTEVVNNRSSYAIKNSQEPFEMRAGIHTGEVVAGIVGIKKFQYDIWGDTVNTASRMESFGEIGKVNISAETYELLKDDPSFSFEPRGKVEVKGKGKMQMYFVQLKSVH